MQFGQIIIKTHKLTWATAIILVLLLFWFQCVPFYEAYVKRCIIIIRLTELWFFPTVYFFDFFSISAIRMTFIEMFYKAEKKYKIVCCAQSAAQTAEKWKQLWLCLCGPNTIPELFKFERWTKGRSYNIFMKLRQTKLVLSWMKEFFCSFADRYIYRPHFGVRILAYGSIERYI